MSDPITRLNAALEGRYTIERELGQGGMATVYLADDVRHRRKVALKVLRPDLAATLGTERFLREIEIAANLTHPHILPLHDSGEADGFLFYVLPYVEGESLRDRLVREGELPVGEAIRILRDVVDALAHAHDHGVVHRDIKPDNVMLSGRHAMVTDFGVAKAVSQATGRHQLTTMGVALGTPAYMAPEQAEASENIDHRADIYAVGALAYELLAGQPPFSGKNPQAILVAHLTQAPEPVTEHRAAVPTSLSQWVMRCLEKKPADRWQSAEEMLGHLEALATPSGDLTPTSMTPIPVRSSGLPRWAMAAAAAFVLGLGAWWGLGRQGAAPVAGPLASLTQLTANPLETALSGAAISPDGSYIAYVDPGGLHVQIVETGERRTLTWTPRSHRGRCNGFRTARACYSLPLMRAERTTPGPSPSWEGRLGSSTGRYSRQGCRQTDSGSPCWVAPAPARGPSTKCGSWVRVERTPASCSLRGPKRVSGRWTGHQTREAWPSESGPEAAQRLTSWTSSVVNGRNCLPMTCFFRIGPEYCPSHGAPMVSSSLASVTVPEERTHPMSGSWKPMCGPDRWSESRGASLNFR